MKKLNSILLIDDDNASNFLHRLIIQSIDCADHIKICTSAQKGLDYLKQNSDEEFIQPDLIILDINMPGMNGWEFLEEYDKLSVEQKAKIIIVMLSNSINPDDHIKAQNNDLVTEFIGKPLTKETLILILKKYFNLNIEA